MLVRILFFASIGASIGWLTNWIAIQLIFRPRTPFRIPLFNLQIQGILPRRKSELARSIGQTVEMELLPAEMLIRRVEEMHLKAKIETTFAEILQERLSDKLKVIPVSIRQGIINYLNDLSSKELDKHLDQFLLQIQEQIIKESNLGQIVEEQIQNYDMDRLEGMVLGIVARELRYIELFGGVLGFLIGLAQALILTML